MSPFYKSLVSDFQLDPSVIHLNHGSFGACPKPIFNERARWQREIEKQPVAFIEDRASDLLDWSRKELSSFVGCHKDDLVYFPNPTTAMNMVIRSLDLGPGDEVLSSNHEYGAVEKTWRFISKKRGFLYNAIDIPIPFSDDDFLSRLKSSVNKRTKVIFLSHITSPTAIRFPIEEICRWAREKGILTIIDGAHAPAQINLDLRSLGANIYTGACHKWMLCPKGVSFLYCERSIQNQLLPLVVSWGWESDSPSGSNFLDHHQYQGTNDISAYLSTPKAIEYLKNNDWSEVTSHCQRKVPEARDLLLETLGTEKICRDSSLSQMASIEIRVHDSNDLYSYLKKSGIVIPVISWSGRTYIRISLQCYNSMDEIVALNSCLKEYLNSI